MKRILLVSDGFYPEISPRSYRATELAKEFCRQGHLVVVVSKFRDHNYSYFLNEFNITLKMWGKYRFPKIPEFGEKPLSYLSRFISRLLLLLFEFPNIEGMFKVKKMLKFENNYDLLISFAVPYPVHWGVAWSRSKHHPIATTWIADCGDPYMGDVLDSFKKLSYFKYVEKWFCRKADFITIPIETAKYGYYSEFHAKIRIIPQGFDFDLKEKKILQPKNEVPLFAYAGGFLSGARNPKPLMNFLVSLNFAFRFLVFTNRPEMFNEFKAILKEKLIVSEYIPRNELFKILSKVDFLINFDNNTKLNSPSKLIDYAIAKKPVLNISKDFHGEDLLAFLKGDYGNQMILPDPEKYHIGNVSKLFLDLLRY
jgi:hypothetical protein